MHAIQRFVSDFDLFAPMCIIKTVTGFAVSVSGQSLATHYLILVIFCGSCSQWKGSIVNAKTSAFPHYRC